MLKSYYKSIKDGLNMISKKWKKRLLVIALILLTYSLIWVVIGLAKSFSEQSIIQDTGTWMNFFGSLLGSVTAVIGAYWLSSVEKYEDRKERNNISEMIISTYLKYEIENNYAAIHASEIEQYIYEIEENEIIEEGYEPQKISFEEFDKVKYELLKFNTSLIVATLKIYDKFYKFKNMNNYLDFEHEEIKEFFKYYKIVRERIKSYN